jgi:shikimate dehydrogenase
MDALRLGLVGRRLGHSRSPFIHSFLARETGVRLEYRLIETEDPMSAFGMGLDGFNVTVPYKERVQPGLARLDPLADRIGAVNCVRRGTSGWEGYNTDYAGFKALLLRAGIEVSGADCLILGTGGAAKCCAAVLADLGARSLRAVSRNAAVSRKAEGHMRLGEGLLVPLISYEEAAVLSDMVSVNATPLGMDPDRSSPLPAQAVVRMRAAVDVVFNPTLTPYLAAAAAAGIPCADGLDMLAVQAARAFELWTGLEVDASLEEVLCRRLRMQAARGLAIVGPPCSGKSTLLKAVMGEAAEAGLRAADLDAEIEAAAGLSIPEIFAREGEPGFRRREEDALKALVEGGYAIIACGGGALTRPANLETLRNDLILLLDPGKPEILRRFATAQAGARPLAASAEALEELYDRRAPVYRAAARIRGDATALKAVIREWIGIRRAEGGEHEAG